ncbi:MAG: glutathione S-transferase [Bdellovibrio sp.]|nr:glutathione S-transferase [Bdellovibrio sp.]
MITVHHLKKSRSHRVLWLLEELQISYNLKIYERDSKTNRAPAALTKIHPLGKSPIITDGKKVISESAVILEYILDQYGNGKLRPKDTQSAAYQDYQYFMHYTEGSFMPLLVLSLIFNMMPKQPMPFFVKPIMKEISKNIHKIYINPQIHLHLQFLEKKLKTEKWFAGNQFSVADIQIGFAIHCAKSLLAENFNYARLNQFLNEIEKRPAYQQAIKKGGPVDL